MSRIVVYSMAHRGDVFPYVPIASELARRGHDVTYVVPREFHPLFAAEPFRCVHSGTDFAPSALDAHGEFLARWGMRFGGAVVLRLYFGEFTVPHLDELFDAVDAEIARADLVVSHPAAALVAAMSCERRGVPWVVGDLFPMLVPTATAPPAGMPDLGRIVNGALWRLGRSRLVDPLTCRRGFVDFRRRLGLRSDGWDVVGARLSPLRNFGLASSHYVRRAPDWPANYHLVGFTPWVGPDGGRLGDEVSTFLDAGPPPVVVTLGTSGASARPEVFVRVARVLDRLGERGLFLTSNADADARVRSAGLAERHAAWPFVPLEPLLPRARALVQSGAHGTNALALRAGVPSAIVPCLFDQRWHARRQDELGTGLWVRRDRDLAAQITRLLSDEAIRDRAAALGRRIAAEDGTTAACDGIERVLAGA